MFGLASYLQSAALLPRPRRGRPRLADSHADQLADLCTDQLADSRADQFAVARAGQHIDCKHD
eukprot:4031449-Pyramimonas_sp.AAC.1